MTLDFAISLALFNWEFVKFLKIKFLITLKTDETYLMYPQIKKKKGKKGEKEGAREKERKKRIAEIR